VSQALRPLWAGRTVAVLAIVLLALNLRTAVTAMSAIVTEVTADVPLGSVSLGIIGMLPPVAFALSGLAAPLVARRFGIETTMLLAVVAMVIGPVVRASATAGWQLGLGALIALTGMGFGNILLPPAIKKYFPDRIAQLTATYATIMAVSVSVPPLIATSIADGAGWRVALGSWALLAVVALVPWLVLAFRRRRSHLSDAEAGIIPAARQELVGRMAHSRVAVAIAIAFAVTALNTYSFFAWLPEIMKDHALIGYEIMGKSNREILKAAAIIAHEHHEKWDGTGYPLGLKGEQIPIEGRITSVSDVYDALCSVRPYKEGFSVEQALRIMLAERGTRFDPKVLDAFVDQIPRIEKIRKAYSDS
jgi:MFS family permease